MEKAINGSRQAGRTPGREKVPQTCQEARLYYDMAMSSHNPSTWSKQACAGLAKLIEQRI